MTDVLDDIDQKILKLLKQDSRLTNKQIGEKVHRTGQAIGARITRMCEYGIIKNYTIQIQQSEQQFIRLILTEHHFVEVEELVKQFQAIDACYKTAGDACYMVVAHFNSQELAQFVDTISPYCHYSVSTVMKQTL